MVNMSQEVFDKSPLMSLDTTPFHPMHIPPMHIPSPTRIGGRSAVEWYYNASFSELQHFWTNQFAKVYGWTPNLGKWMGEVICISEKGRVSGNIGSASDSIIHERCYLNWIEPLNLSPSEERVRIESFQHAGLYCFRKEKAITTDFPPGYCTIFAALDNPCPFTEPLLDMNWKPFLRKRKRQPSGHTIRETLVDRVMCYVWRMLSLSEIGACSSASRAWNEELSEFNHVWIELMRESIIYLPIAQAIQAQRRKIDARIVYQHCKAKRLSNAVLNYLRIQFIWQQQSI